MNLARLSTLLLCWALTACDSPTTTDAGTDAGPAPDAPAAPDVPRDVPVATGACSDVTSYELTIGEQTLSGDTTDGPTDLVLTCGEGGSPQEAIEIVLPGTSSDTYGLVLSTASGDTMFDTVLEIRPTCEDAEGGFCNDDENYPDEVRSTLRTILPGGTRAFVVVSGYNADESGAWDLRAEVVENVNPPSLEGGTALMVATSEFDRELRLTVRGGDADGDAAGAIFEFLDATGAVIGANTDGDTATPDQTEFGYYFAESVEGMTTFTGTIGPIGGFGMDIPLSDFPALVGASELRVRLFDGFEQQSAPMLLPGAATQVALGEACDATNVCPLVLECGTAAVCEIPAAVVSACAAATEVTLVAPTGGTSTLQTQDGAIGPGEGVLLAPCQGATDGLELLYAVTVPAGDFDLEVFTAGTRTGMADTVLYAMRTCGDTSASPVAFCHDDANYPDDVTSIVTIPNATGTYTFAVELYVDGALTADVPLGITFRLRPVLTTGAACDPMGVENRCGTGDCPSATMLCP